MDTKPVPPLSAKDIRRFFRKIKILGSDDCWPWQDSCTTGYGSFGLTLSFKNSKKYLAPRVMWTIVYGPIPRGQCVLHVCDNPLCVNPQHLFLGTQADNVRDCQTKGRMARGLNHSWAKLKEQNVRDIRNDYSIGIISMRGLARRHKVCLMTIQKIIYGITWKHIS